MVDNQHPEPGASWRPTEQLPLPGILAAVQGPILGPKAVVPGPEVGVKYDSSKPDWYIMPWDALEQVQRVLDYGARKYTRTCLVDGKEVVVSGADNWKNVEAQRYFSAAIRHMVAHRAGEKLDTESGLPHLAHATTCLLFMLWQETKETQRGNS